jgi:flagellar motor switch protein FliN/FliY
MGDQEKLLEELGITEGANEADALTGGGAPEKAKGSASDQDLLAEEWAKALESEESGGGGSLSEPKFEELKKGGAAAPARELDFILDIPLEVTVEIGRAKMLINDLLQIGQGSIIELNRLAGEPLDIYVNQKLIARGEVVVVGEKFGVRITDIVSPLERVKRLG